MACLGQFCMSILEELKNKSKIYDPFSGECIIDEYDILQNNEIYLCINKSNDHDPETKCIVFSIRPIPTANFRLGC